ncbi:MAG: flagellar basal body L-ring protein FlgH [Proteobacteria bacterium]|jgi:flagellar L-ring protein precursor FlgH|uniref:flagellar basal body L-ring protein FlgH n=1 Tax=Hyphomicrobiales TaxID=356 RepID=UPI0003698850|nr:MULTISPECIES: flagellar basal body L-ring protein FlgH [Phyllobacteriaceae]MCA0278182.1 flagellar basal body L-ring protein FlgH [Pseudomonadota bacterium]MCX8569839.1 flagellar basal body L-ring protein FlgH [Aminobacter sp. MET-1]
MTRKVLLVAMLAGLSGCAANLKEVGKEPTMSAVGSGIEDGSSSMYRYPEAPATPTKRFSLWQDKQSRMFTDPRALQPGDILTVKISIDDRARFKNESERNRTSNRTIGGGLNAEWDGVGTGGKLDGNAGSKSIYSGDGATSRSEKLDLLVAAVVTDVLPNGNMMIRGSQEVRVNAELRVLTIAGIVRPSDIGPNNTIPYERIAEARISYGGRGRITEVQQPPYGQQVLDQVLPF